MCVVRERVCVCKCKCVYVCTPEAGDSASGTTAQIADSPRSSPLDSRIRPHREAALDPSWMDSWIIRDPALSIHAAMMTIDPAPIPGSVRAR